MSNELFRVNYPIGSYDFCFGINDYLPYEERKKN